MVWGLALVGFFFGVLVLSLQAAPVAWPLADAPRPDAGEAMSPLHVMLLGSREGPVLSRSGGRPLTIAARLASPPDEGFMLDGSDLDDNEPSAMPLLTLVALLLPSAPVRIGFNGAPHACAWLSPYLVRPQLLSRL